MKSLTVFSIALLILTGCAEFRTHSSFVAHVDNTNRLLHEADMSAYSNGCYAAAGTGEDRRNCVEKAVDELLNKPFYGFFKRSIGVVNGLQGDGKVALTDDGTSWYFTENTSTSSAQ
ncbi:MAG: hypothetical protein KJP10_03355 [Gammaproteobacteria bacterium]|nr:hypothetical protein [Gammaproteobacteria bacterium]